MEAWQQQKSGQNFLDENTDENYRMQETFDEVRYRSSFLYTEAKRTTFFPLSVYELGDINIPNLF